MEHYSPMYRLLILVGVNVLWCAHNLDLIWQSENLGLAQSRCSSKRIVNHLNVVTHFAWIRSSHQQRRIADEMIEFNCIHEKQDSNGLPSCLGEPRDWQVYFYENKYATLEVISKKLFLSFNFLLSFAFDADTHFLLLILRKAKFSQLVARELINNILTMRTQCPEFMVNIDLQDTAILVFIERGWAKTSI